MKQKRWIACLLACVMLLTLAACRNQTAPAQDADTPDTAVTVPSRLPDGSAPGSENGSEPSEPGTDTPEQTPDETTNETPDTPETAQPDPDAPLSVSYQQNRYYGMVDDGMACYVDYPRIRVNDAAYTALADALDTLNAALYQKAFSTGEALTALPRGDMIYSASITQSALRADQACLSLLFETFRSDGAEQPEWSFAAANFDPKTGAQLTLDDVFSDSSALPELLRTRLEAAYPGVSFTADLWPVLSSGTAWEERADADGLRYTWALSYDGVEFYFAPGSIADYGAGAFHVTIRYDEQPAALRETFLTLPRAYAASLTHQTEYETDLDGDGRPERLLVEVPATMQTGWVVQQMTVTVNGVQTTQSCPADTTAVQLYLLHTAQGALLYAQCTDTAGTGSMMIFRLGADGAEFVQTMTQMRLHIREANDAFWSDMLTNPEQICLDTAEGAGLIYAIDADGLPQLAA